MFGVETATMWMVPRDCPSQDALVGCQGSRALPFSVSLTHPILTAIKCAKNSLVGLDHH